MTRTALISGIGGQDGSFLAEFLLTQGYSVNGIVRRSSLNNAQRLESIRDQITLHVGELQEGDCIARIVKEVNPDEVYNFGAQSHVYVSERCPNYTRATIYNGTFNLLWACEQLKEFPKFYQASSSEMYGNEPAPQHEGTPFAPVSPYAVAKVDAHELCLKYRDTGLPVWCGILFNHESERRGEAFVTRKISRALGRMACGLQKSCALGNLDSFRDWGYAPEYVECVWKMLQTTEPDDFVIATGESHSVREFLAKACEEVCRLTGLDLRERFVYDKALLRPHEVHHLEGDYRKARLELGWEPKVRFDELVRRMVHHDLELAKDEVAVRERREAVA